MKLAAGLSGWNYLSSIIFSLYKMSLFAALHYNGAVKISYKIECQDSL